MGAAASYLDNIPERVDLETIGVITRRYKINVQIDKVRFDLLRDREGTVSRMEAMQLIENKLPPIYSTNALISM
jgi:hypothetical protein